MQLGKDITFLSIFYINLCNYKFETWQNSFTFLFRLYIWHYHSHIIIIYEVKVQKSRSHEKHQNWVRTHMSCPLDHCISIFGKASCSSSTKIRNSPQTVKKWFRSIVIELKCIQIIQEIECTALNLPITSVFLFQ